MVIDDLALLKRAVMNVAVAMVVVVMLTAAWWLNGFTF